MRISTKRRKKLKSVLKWLFKVVGVLKILNDLLNLAGGILSKVLEMFSGWWK